MTKKRKRLDQLTNKELENLLSTPQGLERVLLVQENASKELKHQVEHTWLQISNIEEVATRWLNTLIVLGLLQLFPFSNNNMATNYLILSLPSFIVAFYSVVFTLYNHPNYQRTDFFVPEETDKITRYYKSEAEIEILQKIFQSLMQNYEYKKRFSGYIGPAVMMNFTASVLYLFIRYIMKVDIHLYTAIFIAGATLIGIYLIRIHSSSGSRSYTYEQDEDGNRKTFTKDNSQS